MKKVNSLIIAAIMLLPSISMSAGIASFMRENSQYLGCAFSFGIAQVALDENKMAIGGVGCAASLATAYHLEKGERHESGTLDQFVTKEEIERVRKEYDAKMGHQEQKHETYRRVLRKAVARKLEQQNHRIRELEDEKQKLQIQSNQSKQIVGEELKRYLKELRGQQDESQE